MPDNDLNDPEDAYDASDPPGERLRNFVRRLDWIADRIESQMSRRLLRDRVERLIEDVLTLRDEMVDT